MTRALVTKLADALEDSWNPTLGTAEREEGANEAIKAAREYLATEPIDERAELIAKLRTGWTVMEESEFERLDGLCRKAADMLEADSKQKETENEQQVRPEVDAMGGRQPMEGSGDCSRDRFNGDDRALVASMEALLKLDSAGCLVPHGIGECARKLIQASITRLEADEQPATPDIKDLQANGKGPAPCARFCEANAFEIEIRRLTAELNEQQAKRAPMTEPEDLYALALKADNWGQP